MLNHNDPEVRLMLNLLEGQRDYAMGTAASLAKENTELKNRILELETLLSKPVESQNIPEPKPDAGETNGNAI
jgi:hypothetical protein